MEDNTKKVRRVPSANSVSSTGEEIVFSGRRKPTRDNRGKLASASKGAAETAQDDYLANLRQYDGAVDDIDDSEMQVIEAQQVAKAFHGDREPGQDGNEITDDTEEDEWGSIDLEDFDKLSSCSEVMMTKPRVLRKRERPTGLQYLVVALGESTDNARWLPKDNLLGPTALDVISAFEKEQKKKKKERIDIESQEDSDEAIHHQKHAASESNSESDDFFEEQDVEFSEDIHVTDEQIARMLSKQEELGIGGDDLVLYNGEGLISDFDFEPGPISFKKSRVRKQSQRTAILATELDGAESEDSQEADQYGGFDVMDRERNSIRAPKGKKARLEALSKYTPDPELQEALASAWDNDRKKKRIRKIERELLRTQGLLGSTGKVDLKAKYKNGITIAETRTEIKEFLKDDVKEVLPLPPLDPNTRRVVHLTANKLGMGSKSNGVGASRHPVLYKKATSFTATSEAFATIDRVCQLSKKLPREPKATIKGKGASKKARPSAKDTPKTYARDGIRDRASYRDGEVVGTGAPELGLDNKGRAMLEKMGWSHGTALGALNNKGIILPVEQIIKTSRAGLS